MRTVAEIIDVISGLTMSVAIKYTITLKCENGTILKDVIPLTKKDRHRAQQLVDLLKVSGKTIHDKLLNCRGKKVLILQNNINIVYKALQ